MTFCLAVNTYAERCVRPTNDEKQKKQEQCNVYLYPGLKIYEKNDLSSVPRIFDGIEVDTLRDDSFANGEWIDLSWYPNRLHSWIRRSDLIFYKTLKEVTNCFPLKSIVVEPAGDWEGSSWNFTSTGKIESLGRGMRSAQAYFAKGLYVLRWAPEHGDKSDEDIFFVDYENKKVILQEASAGPTDKVTPVWRTEGEMKNCIRAPITRK